MQRLRPCSLSPLLRSTHSSCRSAAAPPPNSAHFPLTSRPFLNTQRRSVTNDRAASNLFSHKRFRQYTNPDEPLQSVRNPLNYYDKARHKHTLQFNNRKRLVAAASVLLVGGLFQLYLINTLRDPSSKSKHLKPSTERLDAPTNSPISEEDAARGVKIVQKPGNPDIKIDELGLELVDTGTSSIPHFPRFIKIGSSTAEPSAVPVLDIPGQGPQEGLEEYSLLGLGIRTVSFLSVQVYVVGLYVRTTDLDKLQAAFVKHVNPLGSSLIPSEKDSLRQTLLANESNLEIWDKVLRETPVRSAVRIVPTRGTDFGHLRDGWVRGITSRTQELAKKGSKEFDDEEFGTAMQDLKTLLGGKGKAPKGSTLILARDEHGVLSLMFEPEKKDEHSQFVVNRTVNQALGTLTDERISRQIWLGYLGGKNVSSEGAKKSIVEGVMELVGRPVGTVSTQVV